MKFHGEVDDRLFHTVPSNDISSLTYIDLDVIQRGLGSNINFDLIQRKKVSVRYIKLKTAPYFSFLLNFNLEKNLIFSNINFDEKGLGFNINLEKMCQLIPHPFHSRSFSITKRLASGVIFVFVLTRRKHCNVDELITGIFIQSGLTENKGVRRSSLPFDLFNQFSFSINTTVLTSYSGSVLNSTFSKWPLISESDF